MWQPTQEPEDVLATAEAELDAAESADGERRLKILEDLNGALEAELERPEFAPQQ
jgi:hypothetical protein